jgi:hypothetical protein
MANSAHGGGNHFGKLLRNAEDLSCPKCLSHQPFRKSNWREKVFNSFHEETILKTRKATDSY